MSKFTQLLPAIFLTSPILLMIALAATDVEVENVATLNDMRVARTDLKRDSAGDVIEKRSTCVLMSLSSKKHYRLMSGQTFEPFKGQRFTVSKISQDGSVILEDAEGIRLSINPITDEEKAAYRQQFLPPSSEAIESSD